MDASRSYYVDYGDIKTWYKGITTPTEEEQIVGFKDRIKAIIHKAAQVHPTAKIYRSQISHSTKVGENTVIVGSHVYPQSNIPANSVIYNVKGRVEGIAPETLLNACPITKDGMLQWALLYTPRDTALKATAGDMQGTFLTAS